MTGITLTAAMRANLASLQQTANLLGKTQLALSTGLKVNSATDNPSSFFAAQGLNQNANDLSALLDGMAQSIQTVKAASNGIDGITSLLNQAKAVAQTALTQPASNATNLGTVSLTEAQQANITTLAGDTAGNAFTITLSGGAVDTFTIAANQTLASLVNTINGSAALGAGTRVVASIVQNNAVGHAGEVFLQIATVDGSTETIANTTGAPATGGTSFGLTAGLIGVAATYTTQQNQYNAIRTQIDQLAADASYRGTNLLKGQNLTTQFNSLNTSTLTTSGVTVTSAGLSVTAANWSSTATINADIALLNTALTTLQNDASNFGNSLAIIQARSDFSTNLVGTLKDGANQLVVADKNEEGANMLALQTSQQLGIQSLSLASQANQSVLRLFQ